MIEIKSTIKINGQEACLFKRSLTIYFILMLVHRFRNDCTTHLSANLVAPSALPLHPVNPDNACTIRITAAAGTYLAGAS